MHILFYKIRLFTIQSKFRNGDGCVTKEEFLQASDKLSQEQESIYRVSWSWNGTLLPYASTITIYQLCLSSSS